MDTIERGHSARGCRRGGTGVRRVSLKPATRRGFTLVELLVALAIFITVMSIVAFMFVTAIRTTKQGALNQEAFEMARGAMRLLERDLTRAFTNRDHGDVYSFYGTPIGFTYVGMVPSDDNTEYNIARVTWVIYHSSITAQAGAVSLYQSTTAADVPTYALLRYVEPGVDNLDAFLVPWGGVADVDSGSPDTLEQLAVNYAASVVCPDARCDEIALQTARRDIWIRMLSGGDLEVDSAWQRADMLGSLDPSDYFVTENVRFLEVVGEACSTTTPPVTFDEAANLALEVPGLNLNGELVDRPKFLFGGTYAQGGETCGLVYDDVLASPEIAFFNPNDATAALPNLGAGIAQPFFTYWDIGVIRNNVFTDVDDQISPLAFTFWNDARNLVADGIDNDGDGFIDIGVDQILGTGDDDPDEIYGDNLGSPLDARLPRAVTTDFTLFFRSPYPGAPDFNQRFTQRIDLPTGYRRPVKAPVNVNP